MSPSAARSWFVAFLAAAAVASHSAPALAGSSAGPTKITGSATYHERIALTPAALFEAELLDVSQADARAVAIAQVRKANPGQVPISFEIPYDPRRIEAGRRYVARATIHEGGRLRFTSDRTYPVLTHGHGNKVTVLMRGVPANSGERGRLPAAHDLPARRPR